MASTSGVGSDGAVGWSAPSEDWSMLEGRLALKGQLALVPSQLEDRPARLEPRLVLSAPRRLQPPWNQDNPFGRPRVGRSTPSSDLGS